MVTAGALRGRWFTGLRFDGPGHPIVRELDSLRRQALFELADLFFHLLTRLEGYDEFLWDINALASSRIASLSGRTSLNFEHAKVAKLDSPFLDQRLDDGIERL